MAKFRCKRSGNIVELKGDVDIESMRKAEGYEEVIESAPVELEQEIIESSQVVEIVEEKPKRKGRPRKVV